MRIGSPFPMRRAADVRYCNHAQSSFWGPENSARPFSGIWLQRAASTPELALSVLLRPENNGADDPRKREQIAALRSLGVRFLFSDLAQDSESDLAARASDSSIP